jgi:hypothetical protein
MTIKRRSKIVSFRLSDDEYNSLKTVTESRGARSVSEFTRAMACNVEGGKNGETIEEALRTLNANMAELIEKMNALTGSNDEKSATDCTDFTDSKNIDNKEQAE